MSGDDAKPDLVRHEGDGQRAGGERGEQRRDFILRRAVGEQQIAGPKGETVDQDRLAVRMACVSAAGRSSGASSVTHSGPPVGAVLGDARAHFIVEGCAVAQK